MCKLAPKQQRFVEEYLVDLNAAQAAIRAGYSAKTAAQQAARLLTNVNVQETITKRREQLSKATEITQQRVLDEYGKMAFSDMRSFASWGPGGIVLIDSEELDENSAACVAEIAEKHTKFGTNISFKLHDKKGALDSICKMLGFNAPDKTELSGSIEISGFGEALAKAMNEIHQSDGTEPGGGALPESPR